MFTSIDENAFRQAIRDKDYLALKVSTVSTMLDDPTFERGETKKVVQILKEQVPEIFEDEVTLDYEERLDKSAWDKRYFTKLTYWFQENFALSRIDYIREVGSVVHRDTAQQYKQSMAASKPAASNVATKASRPTTERLKATAPKTTSPVSKSTTTGQTQPKTTRKPEESRGNFPVAGAILAAGALVLVGILLIKLL